MAESKPRRTGKRCVAFGCSNNYSDVGSLHKFPQNPLYRHQWTRFVKTKRHGWDGPTKHSVLCSKHFSEDSYPSSSKYRILEESGKGTNKKWLKKEAIPTIYNDIDENNLQPPSSKRQRMAFTKRESQRILSEYNENTDDIDQEEEVLDLTESGSSTNLDIKKQNVGCQINLKKSKRSVRVQTSRKTTDKGCQTNVKVCSIGIQCDLITAPLDTKTTFVEDTSESGSSQEDKLTTNVTDLSFEPSDNESNSSTSQDGSDAPKAERTFLVFEENLLELFTNCRRCAGPTLTNIKRLIGSMVQIEQECGFCRHTMLWNSQRMIGAIPAGNLLLSCGVLFSGSLPSKCLRFMSLLNMVTISEETFFRHQKSYLQPAILEVWNQNRNTYISTNTKKTVCLAGDGRADTPGHSAKFGSYSLMDVDQGFVVELKLVQSNEVGSSCQMEKEGLIRCIESFQETGIEISTLITDRHAQVLKWVRENLKDTKHTIDVWHVAKGLKKKLTALSKEKGCEDLVPWIKSISNHLYWVAASTPSADGELMAEKWQSILNHIQDIHTGHGDLFTQCCHNELVGKERKKMWLKAGTKVCEKLQDVVTSRQMLKDVPMLSTNHQTSSLESFHSVINHFAPKMIGFSYHGQLCRLMLAALHFNENAKREHVIDHDGDLCYRISYPKFKKGEYSLKKTLVEPSYNYTDILIKKVIEYATR